VPVQIRVEGVSELRKKLGGPPRIYVPAVKDGLKRISNVGVKMLRSRSTRMTGKLQRGIRPKYSARGLFAGVAFNPEASQGRGRGRGFRSGWAFDASTKFKPRGQGMTTGWISGARQELKGTAEQEIREMARDIEQEWSRG
jgi:hypothetical protein